MRVSLTYLILVVRFQFKINQIQDFYKKKLCPTLSMSGGEKF